MLLRSALRNEHLVARFGARVAAALVVLAAGGLAFALLLVLVESEFAPLRELDLALSRELNDLVSGSPAAVSALRFVTTLGDAATTVVVLTVLTAVLLVRRLPRLAIWVAVTGLGLAVLDPGIKELVGRPRPVLPAEVATAPGHSFPSGHALGSFTTFTVLLLTALPTVPRQARRWAVLGVGAVVVAVGFTRVALGVHYLSDVLAGWALGAAWVTSTALAFRAWKVEAGEPVPPVREGLEPAAGPALQPAPGPDQPLGDRPGRALLVLGTGWLGVTALVAGFGLLATEVLPGTALGRLDRRIVRALAEVDTPWLDPFAQVVNDLGSTPFVVAATLSAMVLAVAVLESWRPAVLVAVAMLGEVTVYLLVSRVLVPRDRPLAGMEAGLLPPTASFPSGHAAAAMVLYGAIGVVVLRHVAGRRRWVALAVPVVLGLLVAAGRLHRGVHYPTDVLGSVLLAVTWLAVAARAILGRNPLRSARRHRATGSWMSGRDLDECWVAAVTAAGGDPRAARASAEELVAAYDAPSRRYHDAAHARSVVRDALDLAARLGLRETERVAVTLAACAHDVVYEGEPGEDERRSARWADDALATAGVPDDIRRRVSHMVLATATHAAAEDDRAAGALLDADLAVLGSDDAQYDRYRQAVRAEYAALDDATWRTGRAKVLCTLLARARLFHTDVARDRWEQRARSNLERELSELRR